jgi:hypothetical protein
MSDKGDDAPPESYKLLRFTEDVFKAIYDTMEKVASQALANAGDLRALTAAFLSVEKGTTEMYNFMMREKERVDSLENKLRELENEKDNSR